MHPSCWSSPATSSQPKSLCQGHPASSGVLACIRLFPFLGVDFVAAAEQDPLKLGAKGNLHHPLLSWNRSVRGAEGSSRNIHLKRAESTKAASFPVLPPSSKRRRRSSGEGKHRNHKLEPQHGQRKLVEIFQLGNRWSQAIKCFSQPHSLTALGPPCSISHTARLATYKIKASDHKHKKELCSAF